MFKYLENVLVALGLTLPVVVIPLVIWGYFSEVGLGWLVAFATPLSWLCWIGAAGSFILTVTYTIQGIRQRDLRFSLRSLLIATTLVAVALGAIVLLNQI